MLDTLPSLQLSIDLSSGGSCSPVSHAEGGILFRRVLLPAAAAGSRGVLRFSPVAGL
jgi:hypothetical protein